MTNYNKATLATFFETNDVPQGSDYTNLINSQVNIVESSLQQMGGALSTTELITPRVSATNGNFTVSVSSPAVFTDSMTVANVSADAVYASALRTNNGTFNPVVIISAAGTTQATAALITGTFVRGQGATDGQTTGFLLPSNKTGLVSYFVHEGTVSANLWPPTGGTINALSTNVPFPLVASTPYTIFYKAASAYAVK